MVRSLFTLLFVLLPIHVAKPNGGTFANSAVHATGHLVPQQKNRIALESEILRVKLEDEWALVSVEYHLINRGGRDTVTYGFPLDSVPMGFGRKAEGISQFEIRDGDRRLDVRKVINEPSDDSNPTEQPYGKTIRDWFFSRISFARGERKTLFINYRVRTFSTVSGTSKSFRWKRSENVFRYSFRPAQTWGNGRLGALRIEVDARALHEKNVLTKVVSPPGAVVNDGVLIWELRDVDLRNAPDLVVNYDFTSIADRHEIGGSRLPREMIESIRASSTLPRTAHTSYGVENLLDGRSDTAWIEGRPNVGRGEWIEIVFKPGAQVRGIGILNGYTKSAKALRENGFVRRIQVRTVFHGDWMDEKEKLKSPTASAARQDWPISALAWVFDAGDGARTLKKVRLTILDAASGAKFDDTAISELFIYGWGKRPGE